MDKKKIIAVILIVAVVSPVIFIYFEEEKVEINKKPVVEIVYPRDGATVSKIVTISGSASDPDGDDNLLRVEIKIIGEWVSVEGNTKWSYEWRTYGLDDDIYTVNVRSWDGADYSEIEKIKIRIQNPEVIESDAHKWAIFMAASNFPEDNESKLGNGALNFAEKMASFFIEHLGYPTDNIILLFDDGWIRKDNGYGEPFETLEQRKHRYDITYGGATKVTVVSSLEYVVDESNKFEDSEIFVWIASHGCGDDDKKLFGGKILERSAIFLWDDIMTDVELGDILMSLKSDKTCVIVDACYSGGFADKTIFNFPEFFLLKSNIPNSGRVVITGASKFRLGYASTIEGPLFSQLWFNGIESGDADGFKPSIFDMGRPTILKMFKDGKVSVEEAFYYAKYILRTNKTLKEYSKMEPQINDQYPRSGSFGSLKGMILGE